MLLKGLDSLLLLSGLLAERFQLLVMQQQVKNRLDVGCSPCHLQSCECFNDAFLKPELLTALEPLDCQEMSPLPNTH